jgi:F-type H+-transporting ATPase subunit alpha
MSDTPRSLEALAGKFSRDFDAALESFELRPDVREVGVVTSVGAGIARVRGLPNVRSEELLRFDRGSLGTAFNLDPDEVGVVLLDETTGIEAGDEVRRTGRVMDVPVGEGLLGRVVDAAGRPMDDSGPIRAEERRPVERPAPPIMDRAGVDTPLQTGIKAIDALIPIGRGQRELIVGDRQTGKTAIAVDAIVNQRDKDVVCVYCAIGQRASAVGRVIADLSERGSMDYTTVVVTTGDDPPGLQFIAPYAAQTMAEYFMDRGRNVLVVFDDLTHHARAYREVSLLLRRPPGREAFPGDIFYIHSRLLERATHLREDKGGGSVTALPIVETEAQNLSAYIPTNLIGITDGQIYLSPDLFQKAVLPAVDVGRSVSRVGGKAQLPAYRAVADDLKLAYAQFEELERFSRYGTRLEESVRKQLERGRRVREALKQPQFEPIPVAEQIAAMLAATEGFFDDVEPAKVAKAERAIREAVVEGHAELAERIAGGEKLSDADLDALRKTISEVMARVKGE